MDLDFSTCKLDVVRRRAPHHIRSRSYSCECQPNRKRASNQKGRRMLTSLANPCAADMASPWKPPWLPNVEVAGTAQMPVLTSSLITQRVQNMQAFTKPAAPDLRASTLLHGFVADHKLRRLVRDPGRYLTLAAEHLAVVTPDLSIRDGMPPHERFHSAWLNRAVGAFFQSRGLQVIPSVRWSTETDLEVMLDGLPCQSAVVLSVQSMVRDFRALQTLSRGIPILLERLAPKQVFLYGQAPEGIAKKLHRVAEVFQFPTDARKAFQKQSS